MKRNTKTTRVGYILLTILLCVLATVPHSNGAVLTITVGSHPNGVAVTPNGVYTYVTNWNSHSVSVINTATNEVVATVPVRTTPVWSSYNAQQRICLHNKFGRWYGVCY